MSRRLARRALGLVAALAAAAAAPAPAAAQEEALVGAGRRPGLGGRTTRRSMTIGQNSLYVIAGPWAPPLLGQRRDGYGFDGGLQLTSLDPDALAGLYAAQGTEDTFGVNLNLGVGFGLYERFEAGAMFLSFRFTPDFDFGGFPVFLTYWWELGPVDVGARVVWFSFAPDARDPDDLQTSLNPGVPVVVHLGTSRLDTGVFLPIGFRGLPFDFGFDVSVAPGLSVPLRYTVNPIPELTLGLETGLYDDDLTRSDDLSVPLGGFVGGTFLLGDRLLDVGLLFQWDQFLRPDRPEGVDAVQTGFWRVSLGASLTRVVL